MLSYAQDDLNIHGVVSDAMSSSKLDGVKVTVKKNGTNHDSFTTRANGKYEFYLDCDSRYDLIFQKDGYVDRSITIDATNVPPEVIGAGIIMPTDMSMYEITEAMKGADLSVFNEPIGKAKFDPAQGDLVWDFTYTNKVKNDIMSFMRDVEKKQKELDKQDSEADKAAKAQEEKFNQLVKDGDAAMSKSNYQDGVLNYQAALAIKPDNLPVKGKLGDAQTKFNNEKAAAEKAANYATALDKGDGFMRTEEYDKAIESYNAALEIKPDESYPKDQITNAEKIKKDRAENLAKQDKFNKLMGEGATAFDGKKYEDALAKYQEAQTVIPDNGEVAKKIKAAQDAIANKDKMAKIQADYDALIASADQKFTSKNFKEALPDYQAAAKLLPDETYPNERIAACNAQIAENAAAAEKQISFDALMKEGTDALTATNYQSAIEKFNGALAVFPKDATASAKLKEAQGLLNEKNAQAEKQTNYDALISDGDKLFGKEEFAEAKTKYQEAKKLIPEETYPLDQITKIDAKLKTLADSQKAQETYDAAMKAGQTAEEGKKYGEAISQYQAALAVFADDKAAQSALDNVTKLKTEYDKTQAAEEKYANLVASADEKFKAKKYEAARTDYQGALNVKADEAYPKSQLELIDQAIVANEKEAADAANQAKLQAEYDGFMSSGDIAMGKAEFAEAISQYENALGVKEGDAAATNKRDVAQAKLKEKESKMAIDDQYSAKIADADKKYGKNDFQNALTAYQEASQLKDSEKYPKDQIALIQEQIASQAAAAADAEMQAKIDQVNAMVLEGDNLVKANSFEKGIVKYEGALSILPDRADVAAKRDEAMKQMLAFQESAANQEAYQSAIDNADKAFKKENWKEARTGYQNALSIKTEEQYPKDQIADIDSKIAAAASDAEKAKQAELQSQFDDLISDGDKDFKRQNYNEALNSYQSALDLLPGNEVAIEKIGAVNEILGQLDAKKDARATYEALIGDADELFDAKSYEMSRLKYLDAQEAMPNEKYPPKRITEIDILLEKQRLASSQAEVAAKEKAYNDAVKEADDLFAGSKYDDAIDSYKEALTIKPAEVYPQGQIEKIKLLKEQEASKAAEKSRIAEQEEEAKAIPERKKEVVSNVNTNSEEQAEQFMRDAREAQEREKYERIKKQKEQLAKNNSDYRAGSDELRKENQDHIESLQSGLENQDIEAVNNRSEKVNNSVAYKKALLRSRSTEAETETVHRKDAYDQIKKDESNRSNWLSDRKKRHEQKVRKQAELKEQQLQKIHEWSDASVEERLKLNKENQQNTAQRYTENKVADDLRAERATDFSEKKAELLETRSESAKEDLEKVRNTSQELTEQQENYFKSMGSKNDDKVNVAAKQFDEQRERYASNTQEHQQMAEKRRGDAMDEARKLFANSPKEYADYYRSLLAVNYPQGVSEESSTMGNKVIITRIVVKGNRGDEYKKVLDKSGNYYFKNGLSISENTWNRETIDAFNNKSKD